MDNFSAEKNEEIIEKELSIEVENEVKNGIEIATEIAEGDDIEFDEDFDLDALQQTLQTQLAGVFNEAAVETNSATDAKTEISPLSIESSEQVDFDSDINAEEQSSYNFEQAIPMFMQNLPVEVNPNSKKYVIYVDPENIDFIESLSIDDRKAIINKILKEQDEKVTKQKEFEKRKRFFNHAIIICMTVIIGLPVMFYLVNKSVEITMNNYRYAQENFIKLYREKGKLQPSAPIANKKVKH